MVYLYLLAVCLFCLNVYVFCVLLCTNVALFDCCAVWLFEVIVGYLLCWLLLYLLFVMMCFAYWFDVIEWVLA